MRMTPRIRLAWMAADAGCLMLALSAGASAQVRRAPDIGTTLSQDASTLGSTLFARDDDFLIAGGVVLHGSAAFRLEQDGREIPVPARDVVPVAEPDGRMALRYHGVTYPVGMPAGLVCPLGHFVARHGLIAYTVVHFMDDDSPRSLMRAGVVRAANAAPTQYDVVNFYQVAGMCRQLEASAPAAFATFVKQACQA